MPADAHVRLELGDRVRMTVDGRAIDVPIYRIGAPLAVVDGRTRRSFAPRSAAGGLDGIGSRRCR